MIETDPLKVLVVDDEPLARTRMIRLCTDLRAQQYTFAECENGVQCLDFCRDSAVDLILLDVEMPGMTGIDVAQVLQSLPHTPYIIFCTAYSDFALQAFDASAVDYLLKPVALNRLQAALEKAERLIRSDQQITQAESSEPLVLWATTAHGKQRVLADDIRLLKADSKYVQAITDSGELLLDTSLKKLEGDLGSNFLRVHRSALINTRYFEACERLANGDYVLTLNGIDERPSVSRRLLPSVQRWIKQHAL